MLAPGARDCRCGKVHRRQGLRRTGAQMRVLCAGFQGLGSDTSRKNAGYDPEL